MNRLDLDTAAMSEMTGLPLNDLIAEVIDESRPVSLLTAGAVAIATRTDLTDLIFEKESS